MTRPPVSLAKLARKYRVRVSELRLLTTGTLDDPAFVDVVRRAAGTPRWELVEPDALWWILQQSSRLETLGGTLDHLLDLVLENIEVLKQPCNASYGKQHSVCDVVEQVIDLLCDLKHDADLAHGRRMRKVNPATARAARTLKADLRAAAWLAEVEARPSRQSEAAVHDRLAGAAGLSKDAIRKAIDHYRKKGRTL